MRTSPPRRLRAFARLTPLASCLLATFAWAGGAELEANAPQAPITRYVKTCGDNGDPDSLRQVVASAVSGDTVSLSKVPMYCGGSDTADVTITLAGVEVAISLDDLTLEGPDNGMASVTISAGDASRVFNHTGAGTLTISRLTVADGNVSEANAHGGCVSSQGDVTLLHSTVSGCNVVGTTSARGGGVYAFPGKTQVLYSDVSNNVVTLSTGAEAGGGGVFSNDLFVKYSNISANRTFGGTGGGGLYTVGGSMIVKGSTIDHNQSANGAGGGLIATRDVSISNSTISYNTATRSSAVMPIASQALQIYNSTIASNHTSGDVDQTGAIELRDGTNIFESSIVATNTAGINDDEADLYSSQPLSSPALTGSHNVVGYMSPTVAPPSGFSVDVEPLLGPLSFNGGPTRTQALLAGSPAIGAGGVPSPLSPYDQRGHGHPRLTMTSSGAVTDIGAYGYETIFADGLD